MSGVAKPGKTPEEVEQALYKEIESIQKELVDAKELQKVKNQYAAGVFRGIQSNFGLMVQLLLRDNNRGWETINTDPARHQAVTPEDIRRVANTYFKPENRTIAHLLHEEGGGRCRTEDPALAGLSDQEKAQIGQMKGMLAQAKPEQLKTMLATASNSRRRRRRPKNRTFSRWSRRCWKIASSNSKEVSSNHEKSKDAFSTSGPGFVDTVAR